MGRKRNIQRYKNIFCYAGCLIYILLFMGCQYIYYPKLSIETIEGQKGRKYLQKAKDHVVGHDFKKAFEENQKAYNFFPPQLKQEAIFQKALIFAHPDNPDRNYEKAIVCFEFIDKDQNNTIAAYNSVLIFPVLKESCALAKKASSTSKGIQKNKKKMEESKKKIEKSKKKIEKSKKKIEKSQKKIATLMKEQKKLKKYIAKLRQQIKQLKEIDLNSSKGIQGVVK